MLVGSWHAISNLGWDKFRHGTATGPRLEVAAFIWHSQTEFPASKFQPWNGAHEELNKERHSLRLWFNSLSSGEGSFTGVATPSALNYSFVLFYPESNLSNFNQV